METKLVPVDEIVSTLEKTVSTNFILIEGRRDTPLDLGSDYFGFDLRLSHRSLQPFQPVSPMDLLSDEE